MNKRQSNRPGNLRDFNEFDDDSESDDYEQTLDNFKRTQPPPRFGAQKSFKNQSPNPKQNFNNRMQPRIDGDYMEDERDQERDYGGNLNGRGFNGQNNQNYGGYNSQMESRRPTTGLNPRENYRSFGGGQHQQLDYRGGKQRGRDQSGDEDNNINQHNTRTYGGQSQHRMDFGRGTQRRLDISGDDDSIRSDNRSVQQFSRTYQNNRGGGFRGSTPQNQFSQNDEVDQILDKVYYAIQIWCSQTNLQVKEFFNQFDPYNSRVFQDWEIISMFQLTQNECDKLRTRLSRTKNEKGIAISSLLSSLNINLKLLDKSLYRLKKDKEFNTMFIDLLREIAKIFKQKFDSPQASAYQDAFNFLEQYQGNNIHNGLLESGALIHWLNNDHQGLVNPQFEEKIIRYLMPSNLDNLNLIHIIQFVQGFSEISPDLQNKSISQQSSRTSFRVITNLQDSIRLKLSKEKATPTHPLLKRLSNKLKEDGVTIEKLQTAFPKTQMEVIKNNLPIKTDTALQSKLRDFFNQLKPSCFSTQEIDEILKMYSVETKEQHEKKTIISRPNATGNLRTLLEATPIEEQDENPTQKSPKEVRDFKADIAERSEEDEFDSGDFEKDEEGTRTLQNESMAQTLKTPPKQTESKRNEVNQSVTSFGAKMQENQVPELKLEEMKEGGEEEMYFDLRKFIEDVRAALADTSISAEEAIKIVHGIFEKIKRWKVITGDSLLRIFKRVVQSIGKTIITKDGLRRALTIVMEPQKPSNQEIDAAFLAYEETTGRLNYVFFYDNFEDYANLKQLHNLTGRLESVFGYIKEFLQQKDSQSLLKLLAIDKQQKEEDKKFYTNNQNPNHPNPDLPRVFQPFSQLYDTLKNYSFQNPMHQKDFTECRKDMRTTLNITSESDRIDLVHFQDLMGYQPEERPNEEEQGDKVLRQVVLALIMTNGEQGPNKVSEVRDDLLKSKKTTMRGQNFMNYIKDLIVNSDYQFEQFKQDPQKTAREVQYQFVDQNKDFVNIKNFLDALEFESNKVYCLLRFYLSLQKQLITKGLQFESVKEIFQEFSNDQEGMNILQFKNMLAKFQMIEELDDINKDTTNFRYFEHDYCDDPNDDSPVNYEMLVKDAEFFEGVTQQIANFFIVAIQGLPQNIIANLEDMINTHTSQRPQFGGQQRISLSQRNWIHAYDFIEWFQQLEYFNFDKELIGMFVEIVTIKEEQPNMIYVPRLLDLFRKNSGVKVNELENEFNIRLKDQVLKKIASVIFQSSKNTKDYPFFNQKEIRIDDLMRELNAQPFEIQEDLTDEENQDVQNMLLKVFKVGYSNNINTQKLFEEIELKLHQIVQRRIIFSGLRAHLEKKGTNIENAVAAVKTQFAGDYLKHGFEYNDLVKLCDVFKFVTKKEDLEAALKTFDRDIFGEIPCQTFINEFNNLFKVKKRQDDQGGFQLEAKRMHFSIDQVLQIIGNEIVSRQLKDFGGFLKGFDFNHNNKIERTQAFQVFHRLIPDSLGEGDILDILQAFDQHNTGFVDIKELASSINLHIKNRDYFIKLQSNIDDVITEDIVERIEDDEANLTFANAGQFQGGIEPPAIYREQMLLDIFCGLYARFDRDLTYLFQTYGQFKTEYISLNEFVRALQRISVEGDSFDKENVFKYFVELFDSSDQSIKIQTLVEQLLNDLRQNRPEDIGKEVAIKLSQHLTETKIPLLDMLHRFDHNATSNITAQDFEFGFLQEVRANNALTSNMVAMLMQRVNPHNYKFFEYLPFIEDLEEIAQLNRTQIHIFRTQIEVDHFMQSDQGVRTRTRKFVQPQPEPEYIILTPKNTYFCPSDIVVRQGLRLQQHLISNIDDLVRKTRQIGATIEGHFQLFGTFSPNDGIRKLDLQKFTEAIQSLSGISWNQSQSEIGEIFRAIKSGYGIKLQYDEELITLQNIAECVFYNTTVDLMQFEAEVLQEIHTILFKNGYLDKVLDIFNFFNFNRDCICSLDAILGILYDQIGLKGKISQQKIAMFIQRYAVTTLSKAKGKSPASGEDKQGHQAMIQFYPLLIDLGYAHRGIGLKDQLFAQIAEDLIRAYQILRCSQCKPPIIDIEVIPRMKEFFRNIGSGQSFIVYEDFAQACSQLDLWDERIYKHTQLQTFFDVCQLPELQNPALFIPNKTINPDMLAKNSAIDLEQFIQAVAFLGKKPLSVLYQDIIYRLYIASKELHLSITGPKIINMFAEYDPNQTGQVQKSVFIQKLHEFVQESYSKRRIGNEVGVLDQDLNFLATKYLLKDQRLEVSNLFVLYDEFIDDYDKIEHLGICSGLNELSVSDKLLNYEIIERNKVLQAKNFADLPAVNQQIYSKMSSYIKKKGIVDSFLLNLVNADIARCGHLKADTLKQAINRCGMPVNSKQVGQLTEVLNIDDNDHFNYVQMIFLLLGESTAQEVIAENRLVMSVDQTKTQQKEIHKLNIGALSLSQRLKDEIEIKLQLLLGQLRAINRNSESSIVKENEFLELLGRAELQYVEDTDTLRLYLTYTKDKETQTIDFHHFLSHFRISSAPSELLADICSQIQRSKVDISTLTMQNELNYKDFKSLLTKAGVQVADQFAQLLESLFYQLSEQQNEIKMVRLKRMLSIGFTANSGARPSLQANAPYYINEFINHTLQSNVNLKTRFKESIASKVISQQQFHKLMTDTKFTPKNPDDKFKVISFFKDSRNQKVINLAKIVHYIRQIDPDYARGETVDLGRKQELLTQAQNMDTGIKESITKICSYMQTNKLTKEILFDQMDKNSNGSIDEIEMINYLTKTIMVKGLTQTQVRLLFRFLDCNENNQVSINELCTLIESIEVSLQEKMNSFSPEFENQLKREIIELFEMIDTDHDNFLRADEIVKFIQPTQQESNLTIAKARELTASIDQNSDGKISKEEFINYILPKQKQKLLEMEGEMENYRRIYREIAIEESDQPSSDYVTALIRGSQLSKLGLKKLITKCFNVSIAEEDLEKLFIEMDFNKNGKIDIDEFMNFLVNPDQKIKDTAILNSFFQIRKKHAKINQKDLQMMFDCMPLSFKPSFSQIEIENRNKHTPASPLLPIFDFNSMTFNEFAKIRAYLDQRQQTFIASFAPKLAFEVTLIGEAVNVPLIRKIKTPEDNPHIELRCVLFDLDRQSYLSSFFIMGMETIQSKNKDSNSTNMKFDEALKNFIVRTDANQGKDRISLIFEFVVYCNNNYTAVQLEDKSNQVTVAWAQLPLNLIANQSKHKLKLLGGTPFGEEILVPDGDKTKEIAKQQGFFQKIFKPQEDNKQFERFITVETKQFAQMTQMNQGYIAALPDQIIVGTSLLSFATAFRTTCFKKLNQSQMTLKKTQPDILISQFANLYSNSDIQAAIAPCWTAAVEAESANDDLSASLEKREAIFAKFITRLYVIQNESWFKQDRNYPTRSLPLGSKEIKFKQHKIKSVLMVENPKFTATLAKEAVQLPLNNQVEDYRPFNIAELEEDFNPFDAKNDNFDIFFKEIKETTLQA